jgi:hypothetical protein
MRFKVEGPHREFFEKNGFIEFESLLTTEEIAELAAGADKLLEKRLSSQLEFRSAEELYKVGHDLWRDDPILRKKVTSRALAKLVGDMVKKETLYLAFDQLFRTGATPGFPGRLPASLNAISCIQPLAGALLLHLSGTSFPSPLLSSRPENVMLLSPKLTIPWETFFELPHQSYLLIAYAAPEARYVLEKKDLHTHALKKLGYVFGDRLQADHNPILFQNR